MFFLYDGLVHPTCAMRLGPSACLVSLYVYQTSLKTANCCYKLLQPAKPVWHGISTRLWHIAQQNLRSCATALVQLTYVVHGKLDHPVQNPKIHHQLRSLLHPHLFVFMYTHCRWGLKNTFHKHTPRPWTSTHTLFLAAEYSLKWAQFRRGLNIACMPRIFLL